MTPEEIRAIFTPPWHKRVYWKVRIHARSLYDWCKHAVRWMRSARYRTQSRLYNSMMSIRIYDGAAVYKQSCVGVRRELVYLHALFWLDCEVCNGGFCQFFGNSTGVVAPTICEAIDFYRATLPQQAWEESQLESLSQIMTKALAVFPGPYPDNHERDAFIENCVSAHSDRAPREAWDPWYALDDLYYKKCAGISDFRSERFEYCIDHDDSGKS